MNCPALRLVSALQSPAEFCLEIVLQLMDLQNVFFNVFQQPTPTAMIRPEVALRSEHDSMSAM